MMGAVNPVHRASRGLTDGARAILGRGRYSVIGTRNPDGSVHLVPVMYGVDGDHLPDGAQDGSVGDRILIETGQATRKAQPRRSPSRDRRGAGPGRPGRGLGVGVRSGGDRHGHSQRAVGP